MSRRTSASGDLASRNCRTILRSSSCSSVKAKFTAECLLDRPVKCHARADSGTWLSTPCTTRTPRPRSTRSWWVPWTTTCSCCAARRPATPCSSTPPTSTSACSSCASASGVRTVLETHGHWDHIQAVPAVRDAGYEVGVTAAGRRRCSPSYDDVLEDESVIEVGRLRLHTIHTPGHTPGSMCFRLEGSPVLFSGDTLFPGGPGNTSFEGGDFDHDHRVDRPAPLHPARRHDRAARPRRRHHDRHRAAPPPGVDRPGLVTWPPADERPIDHDAGPHRRPPADAHPGPQHPGHGLGRGARRSCSTSATTSASPVATYKRRIGRWLLWRAGPATRRRRPLPGRSTPTTSTASSRFRLFPDGTGEGDGPERRDATSASGPGRKTSATTADPGDRLGISTIAVVLIHWRAMTEPSPSAALFEIEDLHAVRRDGGDRDPARASTSRSAPARSTP